MTIHSHIRDIYIPSIGGGELSDNQYFLFTYSHGIHEGCRAIVVLCHGKYGSNVKASIKND